MSGATARAEDGWQVIRVGDVMFDLVKPCSRCVLTTVSTERGRKHPSGEPLSTLQNSVPPTTATSISART